MYKPSSYLVVTNFHIQYPTCGTYSMGYQGETRYQLRLRFIHNWIIKGIQWMVRYWVMLYSSTVGSSWVSRPGIWALWVALSRKFPSPWVSPVLQSWTSLLRGPVSQDTEERSALSEGRPVRLTNDGRQASQARSQVCKGERSIMSIEHYCR
jgi:hypothetical protein